MVGTVCYGSTDESGIHFLPLKGPRKSETAVQNQDPEHVYILGLAACNTSVLIQYSKLCILAFSLNFQLGIEASSYRVTNCLETFMSTSSCITASPPTLCGIPFCLLRSSPHHNVPATSPPFDLLLAAPTHPWARATTHTHHSKREPCTLPSSPERPVNKSTYRVAKSSTRRAPRPLVDAPARYPLHLRTARQPLSTSSSLSPKRSAGAVMADTTLNSSSPPVTLVRVFQSNPLVSLNDLK